MKANLWASVRWQWMMRHNPECFRALASSYWHALLWLVVVCVFASLGLGGWLFWSGLPESEEGALRGESAETLSREKLKGVLGAFRERGSAFQEAVKVPRAFADPSK